ncbi:hypothetical protein AB0D49_08095 [Streptomyces sp. NPDC048290]|uniref:hypothetical protein n=1 Tax=Streptomyces sp. NPDC048290 TaxID=3155811 RepID=UPI0034363A04
MPAKRRAPSTCPTGKIRYPDRIAAKLALASTMRAGRDEKRVYRCDKCYGFHLASQAKK